MFRPKNNRIIDFEFYPVSSYNGCATTHNRNNRFCTYIFPATFKYEISTLRIKLQAELSRFFLLGFWDKKHRDMRTVSQNLCVYQYCIGICFAVNAGDRNMSPGFWESNRLALPCLALKFETSRRRLAVLLSQTFHHANIRTATRNCPSSVLGFWDKHSMICVGTMQFCQLRIGDFVMRF